MITIDYKVNGLYTRSVESLEDYVFKVTFEVKGTDGTDDVKLIKSMNFEVNSENTDFIPYAQLTESKVIEWIKENMGEENQKVLVQVLEKMLGDKKNPPVLIKRPALPWS